MQALQRCCLILILILPILLTSQPFSFRSFVLFSNRMAPLRFDSASSVLEYYRERKDEKGISKRDVAKGQNGRLQALKSGGKNITQRRRHSELMLPRTRLPRALPPTFYFSCIEGPHRQDHDPRRLRIFRFRLHRKSFRDRADYACQEHPP